MTTPYPQDEEPTRPNGVAHEGNRLLRNWFECEPEDRRLISALAARLRKPATDRAKR